MKIDMGIGWVPDRDSRERSATPAEYVARIEQLEAALREIIASPPSATRDRLAGIAMAALAGVAIKAER